MALVTDVLSGAILQPLMDVLPNPDIVNLLIELGFSPEPTKKFGPASGQRVEYLERFVMANHTASQSALQVYYYLKLSEVKWPFYLITSLFLWYCLLVS